MLTTERQSARMSKITNGGLTRSGWNRMLYSCARMATVGVKGLMLNWISAVRRAVKYVTWSAWVASVCFFVPDYIVRADSQLFRSAVPEVPTDQSVIND